jgi:prolyl oligopeptidase
MCSALLIGGANVAQAKTNYPEARKVDTTDVYFGTKVADPYRWLENDTTAETAKWVKEENSITQNYLSKIPFRNNVKKRITELANFEKMSTPFRVKDKYYYFKNNGLQNQSVL